MLEGGRVELFDQQASDPAPLDSQVGIDAEPRAVDGWLDKWEPEGLTGWALRTGGVSPVEVELVIDGAAVDRGIANEERADLSAARIGTGRHGFCFIPPETFFDGRPHEVEVREVSTGERLKGCPIVLRLHPGHLWNLPGAHNVLIRRQRARRLLDFLEDANEAELDETLHTALESVRAWLATQQVRRDVLRADTQLDRLARARCEVVSIGVTGYREVSGTIRDKWDRTDALELELVEDGTSVAAARTQAATDESTGAFVFVLPEALLDNEIHEFDLRVKDFGGVLGTWSFYLAPPRSESDLLAAAADPMWSDLPAVVDAVSRHKSRASTPTRTELARADLADAEMDATLADVEEREVKARLVKCRLELAEALRAERNWAAAIDQFRQAQETDPESIEAVRGYVLALLDTGQETAAEQAVEKALLRFPDAGELYALSDDVQGRRRAHAVRTIAFYLPQFHPVPENDQWWGRGFTEWHNVGSGFPMFDGHLQPRRPTTLGYYDLRLQDAVNAQFDLARRYGIDGFCYYYYWFEGRRVLNRPLDELASGRTGPFPFCICWANEDWTRSWDGSTGEVLLAQNHSPEGDFAFIEDIAPLLKNPNYIRVEGRPMVLVYRAEKLATPKATIARWREWCRDQGIGELHLCAVQSFRFHDPRPLGFDAAVEFPPHCPWDRYPDPPYLKVLDDLPNRVPGFDGVVYDYQAFAKAAMARPREPFTLHRTAMVAWDNTARRGKHAAVYHDFSTQTFREVDAGKCAPRSHRADRRGLLRQRVERMGRGIRDGARRAFRP